MLNQDYKEMLLCLIEEKADFLIVGAYALAAHGNPRATGDIDIWVGDDPENGKAVIRALARFGAPISGLTIDDFTVPDTIIEIGVAPCRIDIITVIDGVIFGDAWKNKIEIDVDGLSLFILSKADLLKNKLAANRDKDQSDIAWLKKNQV
ncbi:MAG: hypothetical protein RIR52_2617 [Acidobacteriota bacterium]